jgi:hypothetical protein
MPERIGEMDSLSIIRLKLRIHTFTQPILCGISHEAPSSTTYAHDNVLFDFAIHHPRMQLSNVDGARFYMTTSSANLFYPGSGSFLWVEIIMATLLIISVLVLIIFKELQSSWAILGAFIAIYALMGIYCFMSICLFCCKSKRSSEV